MVVATFSDLIFSFFQPNFEFVEWQSDVPHVAQPKLDYLAPEYCLTKECGRLSDMFSLGVFIHAVFNTGKPVYECSNELSVYKRNVKEVSIY